jgi:hypothetical protein
MSANSATFAPRLLLVLALIGIADAYSDPCVTNSVRLPW